MRKETVATLVASICGFNPLQYIIFDNTNFCREGILSLSTLVKHSDVRHLNLSHNSIGDMNSALCLSRVLKPHPRILSLYMGHCDLGNDTEILSVILQSDVKTIHLRHNNIDLLGAVKILEHLKGNRIIFG